MRGRGTQFFVDLESRVWDALVGGDAEADRALLSDDFVGVFPTGFANRTDHTDELADGPSIASYAIADARLIDISADAALLCYRAEYRRPGNANVEVMFISSLWVEREGRWWNTFSQDTPAEPASA
ncbi:nuclear transport factor 2 family protein [Microbacterium sp. 4R-513]|uniref:nuclear transport factor 2 family protein n=1 Tax=Microbacterium sp. 4R-513 TaxID=2567934 RepID=UPI0013E1A7EA|nr:nuclear transport factor 2 family protein [Microbacterium sp. 4R-513]QIG38863.1 nuclear transport factor 2 family protein [Microbacterium sp. 4R-513]